MTTPTYTPTDIVNFAAKKDAVNLGSAFNDLIGQRVYDAVQARKVEIAKSMFQPPVDAAEDEAAEEEQEAVADQSDERQDGEDGEEQQQDQTEEPDEDAEQST